MSSTASPPTPDLGDRRRPARPWRAGLNVTVSAALVSFAVVKAPGLLVGLCVAAAIGASCEVLAPLHQGRRLPRAYVLDLTHAIGNRFLILPLVAAILSLAAPAVTGAVPSAVRDGFARLPWIAQVALALVLTDFANYWAHRGLHGISFLWSFHAVHHSSERLDWLATSRGHPLDMVFNLVAITLPVAALGQVDFAPWLLTFFFLYPFVCHANARVRIPLVGRLIVTPVFHHWHHAADIEAHDKNFGSFLTIWDDLFGTALRRDDFPERYGIARHGLDGSDYLGQLLTPLRSAGGALLASTRRG